MTVVHVVRGHVRILLAMAVRVRFLSGHFLLHLPGDDALYRDGSNFFEHALLREEIIEIASYIPLFHLILFNSSSRSFANSNSNSNSISGLGV